MRSIFSNTDVSVSRRMNGETEIRVLALRCPYFHAEGPSRVESRIFSHLQFGATHILLLGRGNKRRARPDAI
jgi:hypothetical protein